MLGCFTTSTSKDITITIVYPDNFCLLQKELKKQDASIKEDFNDIESSLDDVINDSTPDLIEDVTPDQSPSLPTCHIRFSSDSAIASRSEYDVRTMGRLGDDKGGGKQMQTLGYGSLIPTNPSYLGEFRERTSSLSRMKPPSIIQKLLNQYDTVSCVEEFV